MAFEELSVSSSLLLITLPSLRPGPSFKAPIEAATARTLSRITIVAFSEQFNADSPLSHTAEWVDIQALLTLFYVEASRVAQDLDRVLMEIDVLLRGTDAPVLLDVNVRYDHVFRIDGDAASYSLPKRYANLPTSTLRLPEHKETHLPEAEETATFSTEYPSTYPVAALGGTFDHLHPGHKILLSMAAWIAHEKVIIGVTEDVLLQRKANKDVMETFPERVARVRQFLTVFKPGLVYDIVPIHDVYGPTAADPNIQALVVSKETLSGGAAVASLREERGLPPLQIFVIDVISATSASIDHEDMDDLRRTKMSSTFIREWIVQQRSKDDLGGRE